MEKIITTSARGTFQLGATWGRACHGGEVFLLSGNLGAGKTKLLQGLAKGLGVKGRVNSPTFNILKIYEASGPVKFFCHIDAYRLKSAEDLRALGVEEFLNSPETVTAVEWAEKVKPIWPKERINVKIKLREANSREIIIN